MAAKQPPTFRTRSGCLQCKRRKIKCDELKPSCANCVRHKASCSYLQFIPVGPRTIDAKHWQSVSQNATQYGLSPQTQTVKVRSNIPAAPSPLPLHFTTLDLELFHFYLTKTSDDLLGYDITGTHIWQTSVIVLALEHPFLLQEILSLAGLHLAFIHEATPMLCQKYREVAILYHGKSIARLRDEIRNISRDNSDACSVCAALVPLQILADRDQRGASLFFSNGNGGMRAPEVEIAWYKLRRGAGEVLKSKFRWAKEGVLGEMIKQWESIGSCDEMSLESEEEEELEALPNCWLLSEIRDEDKTILEETLETLRLVFKMTSTTNRQMNMKIGNFRAVNAWITLMPHGFCEMVENRVPQALVLIGVYCVLLKRVDELWWMRGKAEDLFEAVKRELPDRSWDKWLQWSAEQVCRR